MKRRLLFFLVGVLLLAIVVLLFWQRLLPPARTPHTGLFRTPNSAGKYQLCTEAYAYAHATPDNPFKTDYTFADPFRKGNDTIIPLLMDYDQQAQTVSFDVVVIVEHVATFHQSISHIHEQDGISVILPDAENRLQHSGIPQFIIGSFGTGKIAVLDYTCPEQWVWKQ